jgi:hypothetical protein
VLHPYASVLEDVFVTPCSKAHNTEVFAVLKMSGDTWPGDAAIDRQASELCSASLTAYAPDFDTDRGDYLFWQPQQDGWRLGDRSLMCLVQTPITSASIRD